MQDIRGLIGTKNAIFPDIAHVLMLGERHFDFRTWRRYDLDVYENAILWMSTALHKDSLHEGRLEASYMREACVRSARFQAAALQTEVDHKLDFQHKSNKYAVTFSDTELEYRHTYLLGRGDR